MTRLEKFVFLLREVLGPVHRVESLWEAMQLPEEALPQDLLGAAREFAGYKQAGGDKPDWFVEHEQNKVREEEAEGAAFLIRRPQGGTMWWMSFQRNRDELIDALVLLPGNLVQLLYNPQDVYRVSKVQADAFQGWMERVPGYSDEDPPFEIQSDDAA